ncbi:MAG: hypothetical protein NBV68_15020 [Erythrobacter sp.]|uniref:hypothetical protein n=1 Tax=Erythrobacter sp. TaxID=1042 RepID=UPI0025E06C5F|nr:hypothetical protein [Erythrobacter sp.]MCM0000690.1 hypothetical protein [Erythrobacter sp.]
MALRTVLLSAGFCAAALAGEASAQAQTVPAPAKDVYETALHSIFSLCPALVSGKVAPDAVRLSDFGLTTLPGRPGDWQAEYPNGVAIVDFEAANRSCAVSLSSERALSFGDFVIGQIETFGFTVLVDRRKEAVSGGVWIKLSPDKRRREQVTVVKNPNGPLLTVSYTEKAN